MLGRVLTAANPAPLALAEPGRGQQFGERQNARHGVRISWANAAKTASIARTSRPAPRATAPARRRRLAPFGPARFGVLVLA